MAGSEDYGYGGLYDRAIRALSGARDWYSEQTDPNRPRKGTRGDVNLPVNPPKPTPWYESLPVPDPSKIGPEAIAKKSAQAVGDYSNKLRGQFKGSEDIGDVGEILGKDVVTGAKKVQAATPEPVRQALGHLSGVVGASSEVPGRVAGAALDWSTGSEQKPLSDVAWEGLKGIKSGYEKGAFGATDVGQEVLKRTGSTGNKVLDAQLMLGLGSIDALGLAPKHVGTAALGALTGGAASTAWLPPSLFKRARNIEGFTHKLNEASHEAAVLDKGFGVTSSNDVLGRMGHAGYYTPKEAKAARAAGKAPTGQSNVSYTGGTPIPVDFPETTKILDVRNAPVPKEDFDVIIGSLDPDHDKKYIEDLTAAWKAQEKYAEGPGAVRHEDVRSGKRTPEELGLYYKQLAKDPEATKAIDKFNALVTYPQHHHSGGNQHYQVKGSRGQAKSSSGENLYGSSALNQPGMTGEFGGIHYTDYVVGNPQEESGSMAFDPRQSLFAPKGTQKNPKTTPWQQGKIAPAGTPKGGYSGSFFKGVMPSDAPGGVSSPLPGKIAEPPVAQVPPPSQVGPAEDWAAQNMPVEPPVAPKIPKSWEGSPSFMGKPISTYEIGTLKELEAQGRELTALQKQKLIAIKQWDSGRPAPDSSIETSLNLLGIDKPSTGGPPVGADPQLDADAFDQIYAENVGLSGSDKAIAEAWQKLSPEAKKVYKNQFSYSGGQADEITKHWIQQYGPIATEAPQGSHWANFGVDADNPPSAGTFAHNLNKGGTYDEVMEAYDKLSPGGKADFQDYYTDEYDHFQQLVAENGPRGGLATSNAGSDEVVSTLAQELSYHFPDMEHAEKFWFDMTPTEKLDFTNKYPDLYEKHIQPILLDKVSSPGAAELNRPATMDQHVADLKSIMQDHMINPPGVSHMPYDQKAVDSFFANLADPNLTPEQLHTAMRDYFKSVGSNEAADEVDQLWNIKLKGDVVDEAPTEGGKIDVFDPGSGDTLGTFNSQAEADAFINSHPSRTWLDSAPHDPEYTPSSLTYDEPDADAGIGALVDTSFSRPDSAPAKPKLVKKPGSVAAPSASQWTPEELADFEGTGPVAPPKTMGDYAAEAEQELRNIGSPVVQSAFDNMNYLKQVYPEVAENFAKHSGTEMGSIESHTKDVLKQWKTQLTPQEFADISQKYGTDVEALMNTALPLHDIGKPQAIAAGDKAMQHSHTIPIMQDILGKEGFGLDEINLATELFNHDMIGSLLQGSSKLSPQQVADELVKKANKIGMDPSDFAKLQLAFFQADASSYPFVTQFMKQQPNGGWISGSPKVKPIEDLIQGPSGIKSAAAAADTGYQLKVANAEDVLGGTKNKEIYHKGGQDYLFKEANPPYFADQEVSANKIANLAGLHPIKIEKQTMGGKVGTMQAAVGNNMNWPTLHQVDPKTLTAEELRDVIRNHPVDWLSGNMDAHGAQFLRTPNGIVEIDRGRAFKSYQNNKLHPDYNPTGGLGYEDQFYNNIVKAYKKGELPQLTEGDIKSALDQTIFKMDQNAVDIIKEIEAGLERSGQGHLKELAAQRFNNIDKDLKKFWSK